MTLLRRLFAWFGGSAEPRSAVVEELEPRILYSADLNPALWAGDATAIVADLHGSDAAAPLTTAEQQPVQRREIVFVDAAVPDAQELLDGVLAARGADTQIEVVQLSADRDGVHQIGDVLADESGLSAIHIISHGSNGAIEVGNTHLDSERLAVDVESVARWGRSLTDDGDLMLYGCDVAADAAGRDFVQRLASLTGADVAASSDVTGQSAQGGDWELEYSTGHIEAQSAIDAPVQQAWTGILAITSNSTSSAATASGGATSLTWSHTVNAGSNRILTVGLTLDAGQSTNVTYGGTPLTLVGRYTGVDGHTSEIWRLLAPVVGTANIVATFDAAHQAVGGAATYNGVNQTTPTGTFQGASASGGTTASVTVGSAAGDLVIDALFVDTATPVTAGAGQTEKWELTNGRTGAGGSEFATGASTVMSWTLGTDDEWNVAGVALKPSTVGITVTPTAGLATTEAGGTAQFSVVLDSAPTANVTIAVSSSDTDEGTVNTSLLTFTTGNWSTPQTVTVTGVDDALADGFQAYSIVLGAATSSDANYNGMNPSDVQVANADNDITYGLITVDTTSDASDGDTSSLSALAANRGADNAISLREAIIAANNTANGAGGADRIHFNIAGAGPYVIDVGSALPTILQALTIDGRTEPDYVGTPVVRIDGAAAGFSGFSIAGTAGGSTIRGLMITGFTVDGINVAAGAGNVTIADNWIGTSGTGSTGVGNSGVGNSDDGIDIAGSNAVISGNVITNSGDEGITIVGSGVTGHLITGNVVGLDPDGATGNGNTDVGIAIISGAGNTIGGATAAARNVISKNWEGLEVNTADNIIQGNYVGTDAGGTLNRGNRLGDGIQIQGSAANTVVGDSAAGQGNVIAYNAGDGVSVLAGSGHRILGNLIVSNADLGIDLAASGVTGNDGGDVDGGANSQQNFPVLASANANAAGTTVTGTLNSTANTSFRIEFFANRPTVADVTNGEGERYLGFIDVTTDGSGNANVGTTLANVWVNSGDRITASATNLVTNNSSEFAANVTATSTGIVVVDTTSDVSDGTTTSITNLGNNRGADGRISLREAIIATNATANGATPDKIVFAIPAALSGGVHTITLSYDGADAGSVPDALPVITQALVIDGTSEPDFAGTPVIELNGNNVAGAKGLELGAGSSGSTIKGLIVNRFTGTGIEISSSNNNVIQGNWIGLDATGTMAAANGVKGIYALNSTGLLIGGTTAAERNVVSGNTGQGIYFDNVDNSTISGNYVGTDAAGTGDVNGAVANTAQSGVFLTNGSSGNVIGGTTAGARNVLSGNNHFGFEVLFGSQNNLLQGNYIGTDVTGLVALGNINGGAVFWNAGTGNVFGGNVAGARNVIAGNTFNGIVVGSASTGAVIEGNYIGVGADGVTDLGNGSSGVKVEGGSTGTRIGTNADGTNDAAERNVISGNTYGVRITDSGSTGTVVAGNTIGLAADGDTVVANSSYGVSVSASAANTTVGGATSVSRNVISGNASFGVYFDSTTAGNSVLSNYIGTNAAGTAARANLDGVWIDGGDNNTIGQSGAGNLISGNTYYGVVVDGATASGNVIRANLIGTDATGTASLGNGAQGILVSNGASSTSIGGTTAGQGNTIAFNDGDGIHVSSGTGVAILGNAIHSNTDLGIDLDANGVTANDAPANMDSDSGANNLQNFPVLATAATTGTQVTITGTFNSTASTTFRIEFFASTAADGSGDGEGQTYLGFDSVTTDGSGNATINSTLTANVAVGAVISATATNNTTNDTSEFAQNVVSTAANAAPTITNGAIVVLTATNEDTPSAATSVNAILTGAAWADADSGAMKGIAITSKTGNGSWQYSTDGVVWNGFGAVSATNALLLTSTSQVRYLPDGLNGETATFAFRAWDQTTGTASTNTVPGFADPGAGGGTTAYSSATATASMTVNAVNDTPTVTDRALSFDSTDLVVVAPHASLVMNSTLTIEATVQRTGVLTGSQLIVNKEGEYELGIAANGKLQWAFANTTPGWNWVQTEFTVPADTWVHIAVTYNAGVVKTYVDGALVDTYDGTGNIGDAYPAMNDLTIGGRQNATDQRFNGLIDEVRVWNLERSAGQVLAAYNTVLTGGETGLVGYWRFSESSGTTAIDSSPQGNNGVLGNGAPADVPTRTTNLDYTVAEDSTLNVAASGVLAFATDPEGSPVTAVLVSGPANAASFTLNPNGSFSYTPTANFNGVDSFTFRASDGSLTSPLATVNLTVTAVNDAPVASGSATLAAVNEDTASPPGATVGSLFIGNFSDASDQVAGGSSANTFAGIAISSYTLDAAKGNWQYSTNTGGSWTTLGSATTTTAITLDAAASTMLRFVPAANYNGAATALSANLIESGLAITNGASIDLSGATGGTTRISSGTVAQGHTISAVADTPSVTPATTNEDTQTTSGLVISRNAVDGAEVTHFQITGIANGTLYQNDGTTAIANGDFITFAQGNAGLKFTPSSNSIANGSFTVQASTSNGVGGLGGSTVNATITVNAVADTPSITPATTNEDTQTTSGLVISRNAVDGAEVTHFQITGIANGTLYQNDGTTAINNGDFITFAQGNAGLKFTPTPNSIANGSFTVQASTANGVGGLGGSTVNATITVNAVADTPSITPATTNEDTQTTSGLVISRNAVDGAEVTHFQITGIANGTLYQNDGTTAINNGDFITFAQGNAGLKFTPSSNSITNGSFTVQASTSNGVGGLGGSTVNATITVNAVADTPSVTSATTNEDTQSTSGLVISRNAADGAEVTHFRITGISNGTLFQNDGTTVINNGDFITFAQGSAGLKFTPTLNSIANGSFTVQASTSNVVGGLGGSTVNATVTVNAVADTPSITPATTNEDTQTTSGLVISRNAADGAEVTHFQITGIANGTLYQNDGTTAISNGDFITAAQGGAGLKFTPSSNSITNGSFTVQASTSNGVGGLGGSTVNATITVNPVADTPSVTPATTNEDTQTTSGLVISRNAADGAEVTHFQITGIANGTLYQNDGTTAIANGDFITAAQGGAGLKFTPTTGFSGSGSFTVQASTSNGVGGLGGSTVNATITVNAVNAAPTLTATALDPTFNEAAGLGTQAAAVSLFGSATASTVESGQTISGLTFTVSGLVDGVNEVIVVDGRTITLGMTSSGTTATNSLAFTSTVSAGTATIVLSGGTLSTAATQTLVNGITYQNTNTDNPTPGNRVFTLTQVKDSGGTANGGVDTTALSIGSTATVVAVNDAALLSSDTRNLTEGNLASGISSSGTLTISDVDSPATFVAQAGTAGTYGSFSIDAAGAWTYTASSAHDEFVAGVTYTDTFNVASADGTTTTVTINILGTNDAAVLSSDTRNLIEGNLASDISSSGTLTISDVDSPATFAAQTATAGTYGSFSVDAAGAWTYTASSAHDEFVAGTTYTDTFNVTSADGTTTTVTINMLGTNDAAVLSADTRNLTEGNLASDISSSGTLTISDVDSAATFVAQTATAGTYGTFAIDAAGAWTYTASSAHDEFVVGVTYTDTFNVTSADGTTTTVTINMLGTNDAAVLSADTRNLTEGNTAAAISSSGTLTISDVDSAPTFVAQAATAGTYGTFAIDAAGAWTYTASSAHDEFVVGVTYTDTFNVTSADGTTTTVTINMLGTNDAAVLSADTRNLTEGNTAAAISSSGTLTISDVDSAPTFVAQAATAGTYGTFAIDAAGAWTYTANSAHDEFVVGVTYTDTFNVTSADGTSTTVTINLLGSNDAPVITSDGAAPTAGVSVAENQTAVTTVTSTDVDGGTPVYSIAGGADAARFSIDSTTGTLAFISAPDFEAPADAGADNVYDVTVQVADGNGGLSTQALAITLTGVNEAPAIAGMTGGTVTADASAGTLVATVSATDPDSGTVLSFDLLADAGGLFAIDPSSGRIRVADASLLGASAGTQLLITVRVSDASGASDQRDLILSVQAPPDETPAFVVPAAPAPEPPAEESQSQSQPAAAPSAQAGPGTRERAAWREGDPSRAEGDALPSFDEVRATNAAPRYGRDEGAAVGGVSFNLLSPAELALQLASAAESSLLGSIDALLRNSFGFARGQPIESEAVEQLGSSEEQRPTALVDVISDPMRISSVSFTAGFVWWLTRGGGLLATMLMSLPAWRHIDLLPVLARRLDDEDNDKDDDFNLLPLDTSHGGLDDMALDDDRLAAGESQLDTVRTEFEDSALDAMFEPGGTDREKRAWP